jgi:hypothetical protein
VTAVQPLFLYAPWVSSTGFRYVTLFGPTHTSLADFNQPGPNQRTAEPTSLLPCLRNQSGKSSLNTKPGCIKVVDTFRRGLHLITGIRRNMRNYLMPMADKIMLRKRFVIETVLDTLKSEMGLEHSRHRSVMNAMVHVLSCLVAYAFRHGKPSISLNGKNIEAYP